MDMRPCGATPLHGLFSLARLTFTARGAPMSDEELDQLPIGKLRELRGDFL